MKILIASVVINFIVTSYLFKVYSHYLAKELEKSDETKDKYYRLMIKNEIVKALVNPKGYMDELKSEVKK